MENKNEVTVEMDSYSVNEGFARMTVAAFLMDLNPTLDEIEDVKTAVSEAVTNAIIHGYEKEVGKIRMHMFRYESNLEVLVEDMGVGMEDVELAKQPFYTTKPELERSGMGFAFMEAFMDEVMVESELGKGTRVWMKKRIGADDKLGRE